MYTDMPGEQAGFLWTWWRGDPLPNLTPLSYLTVIIPKYEQIPATLMGISDDEMAVLQREEHRPYIAYRGNIPVAYGWSASNRASFGEGRVKFWVPANHRYLYNFVTLPDWRGRGIYPHLLQRILIHESGEVERFWIVHQLANNASQRGIAKAGFQIASQVHFIKSENDRLALVTSEKDGQRAQAGAELFGLPLFIEGAK